LYEKTLEKEKVLKNAGYKLITIWENDWRKIEKELKKKLKEQLKNQSNIKLE
jgi:G:T-mismatch repair DNA endonuclease (very short patch repair protein)